MNNDIIKLLNLEDDCIITSVNISDKQTKVVSLAKKPVIIEAFRVKYISKMAVMENMHWSSMISLPSNP